MIVKDESQVIRRCLSSVRPLVDYMLIVDTGSTDGTQQIIRNYFQDEQLDGEVIEEPWRDFAYNRTMALRLLQERRTIDYAFIMDADDVVVFDEDFNQNSFKESL